MNFRSLSIATALLAFTLSACLFFSPALIFTLFGIESNTSAVLIAKRAAMLFLGLGVLSSLARNAPHSELRQVVLASAGVTMLSLALLGLFEYTTGHAGHGILVAVAGELGFAASHFALWQQGRVHTVITSGVSSR